MLRFVNVLVNLANLLIELVFQDVLLSLNKYIRCVGLLEMNSLPESVALPTFQFLVAVLLLLCQIMGDEESDLARKTFEKYIKLVMLIAGTVFCCLRDAVMDCFCLTQMAIVEVFYVNIRMLS